jgi:hypothetical protein
MKTWLKQLHAAQATDAARNFAAKWDADWKAWGRNAAEARMNKGVVTNEYRFECHAYTKMVVIPDGKKIVKDASGEEMTIMTYIDGKKLVKRDYVLVKRSRKLDLTRGVTSVLNQYKLAVNKIDFTHEVVVTKAQAAFIEDVVLGTNWGHVMCGLRRKDTGATALYIRHEDKHLVLFEDGTFTKSYNVPEFGVGSWFFNTKVKRNYEVAPVKKAGVKSGNSFSLQAKPAK